jgi:hypothetical protein
MRESGGGDDDEWLIDQLASERWAPVGGRPEARGRLSAFLLDHLTRPPHDLGRWPEPEDHPIEGEDAPLALYLCYELHYRGLPGVDPRWEWDPGLLAFRASLEQRYEEALTEAVGPSRPIAATEVASALYSIVNSPSAGVSVSRYLAEEGTLESFREHCIHRSAYQLKEADPHSWLIPRLTGRPKAALIEIQADEYGGGRADQMHASLFAITMRELGLDPSYHAYLDQIPGVSLSTVNLMSLFGLHRRLRGALAGHLAVFEMTSVEPMTRFSAALQRHGFGQAARHFFTVHIVADAYHESLAARELAEGLAVEEPDCAGDIIYGARAIQHVEGLSGACQVESWVQGVCSLRAPSGAPVVSATPAS